MLLLKFLKQKLDSGGEKIHDDPVCQPVNIWLCCYYYHCVLIFQCFQPLMYHNHCVPTLNIAVVYCSKILFKTLFQVCNRRLVLAILVSIKDLEYTLFVKHWFIEGTGS